MYLFGPTAAVLLQSNLFLFCKYVIRNPDLIQLVMPGTAVTAGISIPIWTVICYRTSKRFVYLVAGAILVPTLFSMVLITSETAAIIAACCFGSGIMVLYMVPWAMLPDVVEWDVHRTGRRREGMFGSLFAVTLKLSSTLALTLGNLLLEVAGYAAPLSTCGGVVDDADAGSDTDLARQSKAVPMVLRLLCGVIPGSLVSIALVMAFLSQGREQTEIKDMQTPTSEMQELQDTNSDNIIMFGKPECGFCVV